MPPAKTFTKKETTPSISKPESNQVLHLYYSVGQKRKYNGEGASATNPISISSDPPVDSPERPTKIQQRVRSPMRAESTREPVPIDAWCRPGYRRYFRELYYSGDETNSISSTETCSTDSDDISIDSGSGSESEELGASSSSTLLGYVSDDENETESVGDSEAPDQIHWLRGFVTPAPFMPCPDDPSVNLRSAALNIVLEMSTCAVMDTDLCYIDGFAQLQEEGTTPVDFARLISAYLDDNETVFVRCSNTPELVPDIKHIHQYFGLGPDAIVDVSECDSHETMQQTFRCFMDGHKKKQWVIRDHPIRQSRMPLFTEHLDHGSMFGWGHYGPGQDNPPDRPHMVERLHSSVQFYPATYLRPHYWRDMVPGIFRAPEDLEIKSRTCLFEAISSARADKSLCLVIEILPGDMMQFDLYAPMASVTTTIYFLNYACFHLTEITRARMTYRMDRNLNRLAVAEALHATIVRMLAVLPYIEIKPVRFKSLLALCKMAANPALYLHSMTAIEDAKSARKMQKAANAFMKSGQRKNKSIDAKKLPYASEYLLGPHEISALKIASRVLEWGSQSEISVPWMRLLGDRRTLVLELEDALSLSHSLGVFAVGHIRLLSSLLSNKANMFVKPSMSEPTLVIHQVDELVAQVFWSPNAKRADFPSHVPPKYEGKDALMYGIKDFEIIQPQWFHPLRHHWPMIAKSLDFTSIFFRKFDFSIHTLPVVRTTDGMFMLHPKLVELWAKQESLYPVIAAMFNDMAYARPLTADPIVWPRNHRYDQPHKEEKVVRWRCMQALMRFREHWGLLAYYGAGPRDWRDNIRQEGVSRPALGITEEWLQGLEESRLFDFDRPGYTWPVG
ncbi:hypothetical protein BDZ97DRAFT_1928166 [Flammula alnicola]|nr:hypothetical protein BDZ97DRAFT_1928166 [Flammula alnicola]